VSHKSKVNLNDHRASFRLSHHELLQQQILEKRRDNENQVPKMLGTRAYFEKQAQQPRTMNNSLLNSPLPKFQLPSSSTSAAAAADTGSHSHLQVKRTYIGSGDSNIQHSGNPKKRWPGPTAASQNDSHSSTDQSKQQREHSTSSPLVVGHSYNQRSRSRFFTPPVPLRHGSTLRHREERNRTVQHSANVCLCVVMSYQQNATIKIIVFFLSFFLSLFFSLYLIF
jgi:hypothetical protein